MPRPVPQPVDAPAFCAAKKKKERLMTGYAQIYKVIMWLMVRFLFSSQKEIEVTSYPEDLFEEQEFSDTSDIDVSGEQGYSRNEEGCDKVWT